MHAGMLTARKHCNAHAAYSKFRSAQELLETFGSADLGATENAVRDQAMCNFDAELSKDYESFVRTYRQKTGLPPLVSKSVSDHVQPISEAKTEGSDNKDESLLSQVHLMSQQMRTLQMQNTDLRVHLKRQNDQHTGEMKTLHRMLQMLNERNKSLDDMLRIKIERQTGDIDEAEIHYS